jgi:glucose/mannose-6-phosphate isomerase
MDNEDMHAIIERFPQDLLNATEEVSVKEISGINRIIMCGMGGSAIAACVLKDVYGKKIKAPIIIVRDYSLPENVDSSTLVITTSYSGNTEETLSAFNQALERGCHVVGVASGGKLLELCKQKNIDYVKVRGGVPPRTAFPLMFGSLLAVINKAGILDSTAAVEEASKALDVNKVKEAAQRIAQALRGKVPTMYGYDYESVLMRAKDEFNENTKIPSRYEVFPELNHNDVVGWGNPELAKYFTVILLRHGGESERMKKRIDVTKELLGDRVDMIQVFMEGKNRLERALYTIFLFDLVSVYLADNYSTDAYEVDIIERLKKKLAE